MTKLNETQIAAIKKYDWYQTIPLGEGIATPGETGDAEQKKLDMMGLPEDFSGREVLDIGCNEGFFSFEAERRGAKRVLAIDKSQVAKEKFALIKELKQSKVEFLFTDLMELHPMDTGKFDIVFFLSVFHHLRYPFNALDRIFQVTRGKAIMEFAEAVPIEDLGQSLLVRRLSNRGHLHFLPTRQFTLEMLFRAGFSDIKILGTHRERRVNPERKMPGFMERRVLLEASR